MKTRGICGFLSTYKHGCRCAICRQAHKDYYLLNKSRLQAYMREQHLKHAYGLSSEDYEELFTHQKGVCAICTHPVRKTGRLKNLAIDHDHETGLIRGLLCARCNYYLGWYEKFSTQIKGYLGE